MKRNLATTKLIYLMISKLVIEIHNLIRKKTDFFESLGSIEISILITIFISGANFDNK